MRTAASAVRIKRIQQMWWTLGGRYNKIFLDARCRTQQVCWTLGDEWTKTLGGEKSETLLIQLMWWTVGGGCVDAHAHHAALAVRTLRSSPWVPTPSQPSTLNPQPQFSYPKTQAPAPKHHEPYTSIFKPQPT